MPGFVNPNTGLPDDTTAQNPGGFVNPTTVLTAVTQELPVPVTQTNAIPPGTNIIGSVFLATAPLPGGYNHLGEVSLPAGQTVTLQNSNVGLNAPLPAGTNNIGIVALANGTVVALQPGTTVNIGASSNHIGSVAIDNTVNITGTVGISALPNVTLAPGSNTIGAVQIAGSLPAGTQHLGEVSLAANTSVQVSSLTLSSVTLNAGSNHVGTVAIDAPIPAGTNTIGNVNLNGALPAGTNALGSVVVTAHPDLALKAGTNTIGQVGVQGRDQNASAQYLATDTSGALVPVRSTVTETLVTLPALTSVTILNNDPNRLLWAVQLTTIDDVLVSESGQALQDMNSIGTLVYAGGVIGTKYIPPMVSGNSVTAICAATTKLRVITYAKV